MKAQDIEVGKEYQTKVGIYWKVVTVLGVLDTGKANSKSGKPVTLYNVKSPAGNTIIRSNGQLRNVQPGRLPIPRPIPEQWDSWTKQDKELAARLRERQAYYMTCAEVKNLATEFGISYSKAGFLFKRDKDEREVKRAKDIVRKSQKARERGIPFMIEDLCDEDD